AADEKAEQPSLLSRVEAAQVEQRLVDLLRQYDRRRHVKTDRLQQHQEEGQKSPVLKQTKAEHGPPDLHVDEQQRPGPEQWGPVHADPIAMTDQPSTRGEDLREAKPDDDREQDREVAEGVHSVEPTLPLHQAIKIAVG